MACEVCQHCETSVEPGDGAVHNGLSYHKHCRQCYVCGESDLRNAETFRGVIFCSGCAQRIFQGCSTARHPKPSKTRVRSPRQKRRRRNDDRVLTMTVDRHSSSSSCETISKRNNPATHSPGDEILNQNELKKNSADRGMTTVVTQETLERIKERRVDQTSLPTPAKPRKKRKTHKHNKNDDSDLRIAELGTSFEIAHVALRKRSEVPVIIHSETRLKRNRTRSLSILNQESDVSEDSSGWRDSLYSTEEDTIKIPWTHRGITSILKIPLRSFKRNILDRSSLISIFSSRESYDKYSSFLTKFKLLFHEDVDEHHRNGVKKLYSTINRKNKPCKMGWLKLMATKPEDIRCKHFKRSHSYRCMREQVMRLAGPTRSELAIIRAKILHAVSPTIIKDIMNYNKKYSAILSSQVYRRD